MRCLLVSLMLLLASGLCAQSAGMIPELRLRAQKLMQAEKHAEAKPLLRDAALMARLHHQPRHQALCMADLADCLWWGDGDGDEDRAAALLDAAARLAVEIGDAALERELLARRAGAPDDNALLDAALAAGPGAQLEEMIVEFAPAEDDDEPPALPLARILELLDSRAHAALHARGGRAPQAMKLLTAAAAEAGKLGLVRFQIALLEDALALQPAPAGELRALYTRRGATVALARLDVRTAPARAEGEVLKDWVARLTGAMNVGVAAGDTALQADAALALARLTGAARWNLVAENARKRARWQLLADAQWAAAGPAARLDDDLRARLLAARGDPEVDRWLARLSLLEPDRTEAQRRQFAAAVEEALADSKTARDTLLLLDVAARPEAAAPLMRAMRKVVTLPALAMYVLEGLCTPQDVPQLLELAAYQGWPEAAAAAAAELFRLDPDGQEAAARKLAAEVELVAAMWLYGYLARRGDAGALAELLATAKGTHAEAAVTAHGVLASLGFASGLAGLNSVLSAEQRPIAALTTLNRLPLHLGHHLLGLVVDHSPLVAARGYARRRVPDRENLVRNNGYDVVIYQVPQNRREGALCGMALLDRFDQARKLGGNIADLFEWAALHAGMGGAEVDKWLAPAAEDNAFRAAARTERKTAAPPAGLTRTLTLVDYDGTGRARCRITCVAGNADVINSALVVPFHYDYDVSWQASGILGALYRDVIGSISLAGLFKGARLVIPGHGPVTGELTTGLDGKPALRFALPAETGEGLGDDVTVGREVWITGVVQVEFIFIDNPGAVSFPVQALEPPAGDKPDLAALEIILDPPMPEFDRPARVTFIARNNGRTVASDKLVLARVSGNNPQGPDGWRAIFSMVVPAKGWQAGEYRVIESRPLLVPGFFMNRYSYLYSPARGDTRIMAVIDAEGVIEETDENNNRVTIELPLELPADLALPQAEEEALKALEKPFADLLAASTMDELQAAYARAAEIIIPLEHRSAAIRVMGRHLMGRYEMKKSNLRARQAMADLNRWKAEGTLTPERVRQVRDVLTRCEADFIASGVPVQANALEKARNATLLANNLAGAGEDAATLMRLGGLDVEGPVSEGAGRTLKLLDGAALLLVESDRLIAEGKADAGNLLDAASNFTEGLGISVPGFSNLHRALLQAEVEYGTKGFEKCADALHIIAELIEKGESKERNDRLIASVAEVDKHLSAGPFNDESLKNIAKGWIKDLPVVGKIADILFSWK